MSDNNEKKEFDPGDYWIKGLIDKYGNGTALAWIGLLAVSALVFSIMAWGHTRDIRYNENKYLAGLNTQEYVAFNGGEISGNSRKIRDIEKKLGMDNIEALRGIPTMADNITIYPPQFSCTVEAVGEEDWPEIVINLDDNSSDIIPYCQTTIYEAFEYGAEEYRSGEKPLSLTSPGLKAKLKIIGDDKQVDFFFSKLEERRAEERRLEADIAASESKNETTAAERDLLCDLLTEKAQQALAQLRVQNSGSGYQLVNSDDGGGIKIWKEGSASSVSSFIDGLQEIKKEKVEGK